MDNNSTDGITEETIPFTTSEENHNSSNSNKNNINMLKEPLLSTTIDATRNGHTHEYEDTHNDEDSNDEQEDTPPKSKFQKTLQSIVAIYTDQSGSYQNLIKGISLVILLGTLLGLIMPKNTDLPSPLYRYISSIIGYTYFVSWSVSFYPQIISNYQNKSTDGFSPDAAVLAVLNYICYGIYNIFFFWDETIRQEYKDQHGDDAEITVMSNDVAYSINALILALVLLYQVFIYSNGSNGGSGFLKSISTTTIMIVLFTLCMSGIYIGCILLKVDGFLWIGFLYIMATVTLVLNVTTYIPQMVLNFNRKSTQGYNIWNVVFDSLGGSLSLLQLLLDCVDMKNFAGIYGNWAKCVLSFVALSFDGVYFTQHFLLYRDNNDNISNNNNNSTAEEENGQYNRPLLGSENNDSDDDAHESVTLTEIV